MPTINVDGRDLDFQPGQTIIEATTAHGIEVPYYCWHPRLSVAANCRMCLVEVEKAPKLLPACEVKCREGMVVKTDSPKVLEARGAVHEFLLINHPIDCPICDQAGECKLQDYYMKHDRTGTRFDEIKVVKDKAVELGPQVMLDEERCINCTRCVRFMDEIAQNPQLGQFDRGDRAVIGTFPGEPLDDPYSLNTVEICPVGALTSRDFRFKVRSWFLKTTDSICAGCARGCNIKLDHYRDEVQRYRGRDNEHVNQGWLCDAGRLSYKRIHDPETAVTVPHAKNDEGRLVPVDWAEAERQLSECLGGYVGDTDGSLALVLSAQLTTEGVTAFVELAEQVLQVDTYAIVGQPDWAADEILRVTDQNPNRAGAELVLEGYSIFDEGADGLKKAIDKGDVKTVLMVGSEYPTPDESWVEVLRKATVLCFSTNWDATSKNADLVIPMASFAEQDGTFVNIQGRIQRVNRAIKPIERRLPTVDAATFTARACGAGTTWTMTNWIRAFNALKAHTDLLREISAVQLGPDGMLLESDDLAEDRQPPAAPAAGPEPASSSASS